jgi:hypothetical protein
MKGLHRYRSGNRLTGTNIYRNAQKPNLKGGAARFLGTKYHSEESQFGPVQLLVAKHHLEVNPSWREDCPFLMTRLNKSPTVQA